MAELQEFKSKYIKGAARFNRIKFGYQLVDTLMISPIQMAYHLNKPLYYKFTVPKKKGGSRLIQAPNADLKNIQRSINYYLQTIYLQVKPKAVHGFILKPGYDELRYNIISNASLHVNRKYLLNMDIQDFFPSITAKRIKSVLMNKPFGLNDEMSNIVALLGTYERRLPTGSPCSPVLANMVCYEMDLELEVFCQDNSITYTRYADDMSFSGDNYFNAELIEQLKEIILRHQFILNEKKIRLQSSKSKQTVTGIVVNEKVNVDRKYIRQIRAILHHVENSSWLAAAVMHFQLRGAGIKEENKLKNKLKGQINFVGQVRGFKDEIYLRLMNKYNLLKKTV